MLDKSHHDFLTIELDPDLLSTPFRIQTKWHVITGAPSCGKTTLIDQLADKGFQTIPESGRHYVEKEMARGRTISEIRENEANFARCIKDMQLGIEFGLQSNDIAFLDRALPDCLSYYRVAGLNPNQILLECFHNRYASIFVLDRFPVQQDGVRTEDDAIASFLDEWLIRDYTTLGYRVVKVPVLPPQKRFAFVIEKLSEKKLK